MAASCESTYISTACNKSPGCVCWGSNNTVIFAACNAVAFYNPEEAKITQTLHLHSDRINSVKWIKQIDTLAHENEFLTASSDKTAAVWSKNDRGVFFPSYIIKGHDSVVTNIDGIYLKTQEYVGPHQPLLVATASGDCSVKIWAREASSADLKLSSSLDLGAGLCVGLRLWLLPTSSTPILAVANDDGKVNLYSHSRGASGFLLVYQLIGHDDWVRSMDFAVDDSGDVLIASGSQDTFIRIWRLSPQNSEKKQPDVGIKLDEDVFCTSEEEGKKEYWSATLDSVLSGHDGWVYAVCWHPQVTREDGTRTQPLCLLSASIDKSMVVWSPEMDEESCVWLEKVRLGEVGGNTLGFYGCQFAPNGCSILAHGYQGSFHLWNQCDGDRWRPGVTVGGHFGEVTDIDWDREGNYVISVSKDQTTRLHAPWVCQDEEMKSLSWHEIARPQVHGHELQCVSIYSPHSFVSGGEEKVVRCFTAPANFVDNFCRISNIPSVEGFCAARGATVPALGLSNKAVFDDEIERAGIQNIASKDENGEFHFKPLFLEEPPTEEDLLQNTVWPETQKLYGHGYEVYCLAASHKGDLVASACKASTALHAAIILWDTKHWIQLKKLSCHDLTVTQMAFSPGDEFLLSVSRDRKWCLFNSDSFHSEDVESISVRPSSVHTRVIWCCAWAQNAGFFATGSRDGKVAVWETKADDTRKGIPASEPLDVKESVSSVAFAPVVQDGVHLLALGLDDGRILLYHWRHRSNNHWNIVASLDKNCAHHLTVHRLRFRPSAREGDTRLQSLQLASAGADHTVKIFTLRLNPEQT